MVKGEGGVTASGASFESLKSQYGKAYGAFAILTIGLGTVATILTSTSINVAIPNIMGAFGIGQDKAQWLSTGFLASSTVTMLMAAWMMQSWGIRRAFIINMTAFIASSLLGAAAPSLEILILSRFLQGASSGLYMPLSMVVLGRIFPPHRQGLAMGIFGILAIMAPALGPVSGGMLIDHFNWRFVFFLALPMAALSLPMATLFLPEAEQETANSKLDSIGVILLSAALLTLLVALSNGQDKGWLSGFSLTCFGVTAIAMLGFIYRQMQTTAPLLELKLFSFPSFTIASIVSLVYGAGLFGSMYTTPLFLQTIQGLGATNAGFVLLPAGLVLAVTFPLAGMLSDKISPRLLIMLGLILFAWSSYLMVVADINTRMTLFIGWLIIGRLGMACIMPALNVATLQPLPLNLVPQASAISNFLRQLGGALGINLSSIFLERRAALHTDTLAASQHLGNPQTLEMMQELIPSLQQSGIDAISQQPLAFYIISRELVRQAFTVAFQDTFAVTAVVFLAAVIPAAYLKGRRG